jgi:hypothetical protein
MLSNNRKFLRTITIAAVLMEVMMPVAMAEQDDGERSNKYMTTAANAT